MPYTHLSRAERKVIHQMRIAEFSVSDTARAQGAIRCKQELGGIITSYYRGAA